MATINNKYVIPETVCRPTGKKDMDDVDICEGDILKVPNMSGDYNYTVKWSDLYACFVVIDAEHKDYTLNEYDDVSLFLLCRLKLEKCKVIGSIHDRTGE